jgi:glycosyltransferase involved in cell wall biosynthesis
MKISVAIITYNHEEFIAQALESVLKQEVNFDYEIVISDDCSTDKTTDIIISYQQKYSDKIRLLCTKKKIGTSSNLIQALKACKGYYVALLEGKDYWNSIYKLQKQINFLDKHSDYTICFHNSLYLYPDGSTTQYHHVLNQKVFKLEDLLAINTLMPTASIVFRRSSIDEFPDWLYKANFVERTIQILASRNGNIGYIDDSMSIYRLGFQEKSSQDIKIENLLKTIDWCYYLNDYFDSKYHTKVKLLLCECYQQLALSYSEKYVNKKDAREYIKKYVTSALSSNVPLKTVVTHVLRIYAPILFQFIKAIKQFLIFITSFIKYFIGLSIVGLSIKHIHGLRKINYRQDELIVTCLVRNGELYVKSFIKHYFSLGIKHIVFLDNGSTDKTIEIAKSYDNVTIIHSSCPYSKYEKLMKQYLVKRFSKNRWNLFVDIDECFDYPFSGVLSLNSFLEYLNKNSYTAVVAQMLDMFSSQSLATLTSTKDDDIKKVYDYYDISNIRKYDYPFEDVPPSKDIKFHIGGIRKTLFDSDNWLTKAPLVFANSQIELFFYHHYTKNAKLADCTCVLLHYPFTGSFYNKVMEAVETDRYALSASNEYKMYWSKIKENPELSLKQETACRLDNLDDLVNKGFLVLSDNYIQWAKENYYNNV